MKAVTVGFAMCGSFCTHSKAIEQMKYLAESEYSILPILSNISASTDTRFGTAQQLKNKLESICNNKIITTIPEAEPIGPKKMCDVLLVAPCTGNTLGKLCSGITDTPVTMAVKSHLRIGRPVLLAVATNDALAASAQNIGRLMNTKNIYFVPMSQDDHENKPTSLVAHFELIPDCLKYALMGKQYQPVFM